MVGVDITIHFYFSIFLKNILFLNGRKRKSGTKTTNSKRTILNSFQMVATFLLKFPIRIFVTQSHAISFCWLTFYTPSYKQLIAGSERPFLGTYFFFRFSPRLSENHHSRVISMGDFGPTASILHYFGHFFLVFSVGSVISD